MSLAQHLAPEDGFDVPDCQQSDETLVSPRYWRQMSFDAFAPAEPPVEVKPPRSAAYKTSTFQRVGTEWPLDFILLAIYQLSYSTSRSRSDVLFPCIRNSVWLRSPQTRTHRPRGIPRALRQATLYMSRTRPTNKSSLHNGFHNDQRIEPLCWLRPRHLRSANMHHLCRNVPRPRLPILYIAPLHSLCRPPHLC